MFGLYFHGSTSRSQGLIWHLEGSCDPYISQINSEVEKHVTIYYTHKPVQADSIAFHQLRRCLELWGAARSVQYTD